MHLEDPIRSGQTLSDPDTINQAIEQFDMLRAQSLPRADSIRLITKRVEELHP